MRKLHIEINILCTYAQAEAHTYSHNYAYMTLATVSNMSLWYITLMTAEKFVVVSFFMIISMLVVV